MLYIRPMYALLDGLSLTEHCVALARGLHYVCKRDLTHLRRVTMKRIKIILLAAVVCILTASCTSDRMLRMSPFYGSGGGGSDRVNLWPIVYSNGSGTSILWPLIDVDDQGFAIRPLLVNDESKWSVLWPLTGWDSDGDWGWLGNIIYSGGDFFVFPVLGIWGDSGYVGPAYWGGDEMGLFPLFHVAKDFDYGCVGTAYWGDGTAGLFPLFHVGDDLGYGFVGPAYWGKEDVGLFPLFHVDKDFKYGCVTTAYWGEDSFGLFPLFHKGDGFFYFGNVWKSEDGFGFFPLLHVTPDFKMLGPFWKWDDAMGLFPVVYWNGNGGGYVGPCWWSDGGDAVGLFPFVMVSDGLSFLGPIWWISGLDSFGLFPIIHWVDDSGWVGPFWKNDSNFGLFPLYSRRDDGDERSHRLLLGAFRYTSSLTNDDSEISVLRFLYRRTKKGESIKRTFFPFVTWDSGPNKYRFSFFWRLFERHRRGNLSGGHILFIPYGDSDLW